MNKNTNVSSRRMNVKPKSKKKPSLMNKDFVKLSKRSSKGLQRRKRRNAS
jgi:hypothetical protein